MNHNELAPGLTEAERLIVMERLYELLNKQTTRYLAGDSTSLPVETAQELFRSIVYTLRFAREQTGQPERELLTADLCALMDEGRRLLACKQAEAHRLWEKACLTVPPIPNDYLNETLKGIGGFFRHYDVYNFAHQIPCTIDYLLCLSVPEELQGVIYIEQWLKQILIENWFLRRFRQEDVRRLLSGVVAGFWAYPNNMCEQPLINAVGLALNKRSVLSLRLSAEDLQALEQTLFAGDDVAAALHQGVAAVATELGAPKDAKAYMEAVINNVLPRLKAARQHGSISGIFIVN